MGEAGDFLQGLLVKKGQESSPPCMHSLSHVHSYSYLSRPRDHTYHLRPVVEVYLSYYSTTT